MSKKLFSTSTGKMDESEPLNLPEAEIQSGDTQPVFDVDESAYSEVSTSGYDAELQAFHSPEDGGMNDNAAAFAQSNSNKVGRAIGGGLMEGLSGAISPLTYVAGGLVGLFDEEAGAVISGLNDSMKDYTAKNLAIREQAMDETTTFWDEFFRASTLKSTVSSAAEFGLMGVGSGIAVAKLGKYAISAGLNINKAKFVATGVEELTGLKKAANATSQFIGGKVAKSGAFISQDIRAFGAAQNKVGRFIHDNLSSNVLARSAVSNYYEGLVMGQETENDMYAMYKSAIESPETTPAMRKLLLDEIKNAGTNMRLMNTAMIFSDIVGFNVLDKVAGKNTKKIGAETLLKKIGNLGLVAPGEGVEEILQNVIQSSAKHKAATNVEERYAGLDGKDKKKGVSGIEKGGGYSYKPEDTYLYSINKDEAVKLAFDNAKGLGEFLVDQSVTRQALIEGLSGVLGGGPQWIITGAPTYLQNRKAKKIQQKADDAFIADTAEKDFTSFIQEEMLDDVAIDNILSDLETSIPDGSTNEDVRLVVEDFAMTQLAIKALKNGHGAAFSEYLEIQKNKINERVKSEELTKAEGEKYKKRLTSMEDKMRTLHNMSQNINASELLDAQLELEKVEAAISVYNTTEGIVKEQLEKVQDTKPNKENLGDSLSEFEVNDEEEVIEEDEVISEETTTTTSADGEVTNVVPETTDNEEVVSANTQGDNKDDTGVPPSTEKVLDDEATIEEEVVAEKAKVTEQEKANKAKQNQAILDKVSDPKYLESLQALKVEHEKTIKNLTSDKAILEGYKYASMKGDYDKSFHNLVKSQNPTKIANDIERLENKLATESLVEKEQDIIITQVKQLKSILKKLKLGNVNKNTEPKKAAESSKPDVTVNNDEEMPLDNPESTTTTENGDMADFFAGFEVKDEHNELDTNLVKGQLPELIEAVKILADAHSELSSLEEDNTSLPDKGEMNDSKSPLPSKVADPAYGRAIALVTNLMNSVIENSPDGKTLPSMDSMVELLASTGHDRGTIMQAVETMYSVFTRTPIKEVIVDKKYRDNGPKAEDTNNDILNEDGSRVDDYIDTTSSYVESGSGIAFDSDLIHDHTVVGEGSAITFEVMSDEDAINKGIKVFYGNSNMGPDGVTQNKPKSVSYEEYLELLAKSTKAKKEYKAGTITEAQYKERVKGNFTASSIYSKAAVQPISVKLNAPGTPNHNTHIGYVHTIQWSAKGGYNKSTGKDVSTEDVKAAVARTRDIRKKVLLGNAGKPVNAKIGKRKSNIEVVVGEHGEYVKGTVIKSGTILRSSSVIFGENSNVIYSVVTNQGLMQGTAELAPGKRLVVSPNITAGSTVVLIELEDSDIMYARKIQIAPVSTPVMTSLSKVITQLDTAVVHSGVFKLLSEDTNDKTVVAGPGNIRRMLQTVLNVTTPLVDRETDRLVFDVKAQDVEIGDDKKVTKDGGLTIEGKVGEVSFEIAYTFGEKQGSSGTYLGYTMAGISINGEASSVARVGKLIVESSADTNTAPLSNIDAANVIESQSRKREIRVIKQDDTADKGTLGLSYKKTNYVKGHVETNTETNISYPTNTSEGSKSYTTNTITSIDHDSITTDEVVSEVPGKKKKDSDKKKKANKKKVVTETVDEENVGKVITIADKIRSDIKKYAKYKRTHDSMLSELGLSASTMTYEDFQEAVDFILSEDGDVHAKYVEMVSSKDLFNHYRSSVLGITNQMGILEAALKKATKEESKLGKKEELDMSIFEGFENDDLFNDDEFDGMSFGDEASNINDQIESDEITETVKDDDIKSNTKAVVDSKVKETESAKKRTGDKFATIKSSLSKFRVKIFNPNSLSSTEKRDLSSAVFGSAINVFLGMNVGELSSKGVKQLQDSVISLFIQDVKTSIDEAKDYKRSLVKDGYKLGHKDVKKVTSYIKALETLVDENDTTVLSEVVDVGFSKAIRSLGYTKQVNKPTKLSQENRTEEEADIDSDLSEAVTSWQDINFSILKNPKDTMTARVKAKLLTGKRYKYQDGEVVLDTGLIGNFVMADDAYLVLADLFAEKRTDNKLKSKLKLLDELVAEIKLNPKGYAHLYYLIDIQEQLSRKSATTKYSRDEMNQFNTAMNKNKFVAKSVISTGKDGNKVLHENDFNFASLYLNAITGLTNKLDSIVGTDLAKELLGLLRINNHTKTMPTVNSAGKAAGVFNDIVNGNFQANPDLEPTSVVLRTLSEMFKLVNNIKNEPVKVREAILKLDSKFKTTSGAVDVAKLEHAIQSGFSEISGEVANRVGEVLRTAGVAVPPNIEAIIEVALLNGEMVKSVDKDGAPSGSSSVISGVLASMLGDIDTYLSSKDVKKRNIKLSIKSGLNWIVTKAGTSVVSAVLRIKSKLVGVYNDPISLIDRLQKLSSPEYRKELMGYLFTQDNQVLSLLNGDYSGKADWIGNIFKKPKRAGLVSSNLSDVDKQDSPLQHAFYTLGSYVRSIGSANPLTGGKGENYDRIKVTKANPNGKPVSYEMEVRPGQFVTLTMSESDSPFGIDSIDFKMADEKDGKIELSKDTIKYVIDSIILPEINRMIATGSIVNTSVNGKDGKPEPGASVADYNGNLVYGLPILNTPEFHKIVTSLAGNLEGGKLTTLFGNNSKELGDSPRRDLARLEALVEEKFMETIDSSVDAYVDHLQNIGVLNINKDGDYVFDKTFSDISNFQAYTYTKAELDKRKREKAEGVAGQKVETTQAESRSIVTEALESFQKAFTVTQEISPKEDDLIAALSGTFGAKNLALAVASLKKSNPMFEKADGTLLIVDTTLPMLLRTLGVHGVSGNVLKRLMSKEDVSEPAELTEESIVYFTHNVFNDIAKERSEVDIFSSDYVYQKLTAAYTVIENTGKKKTVSGTGVVNMAKFRAMLMNREAGQMFTNHNMSALVHGDPAAFYKRGDNNDTSNPGDADFNVMSAIESSMLNMGKRLGKDVSPGVFSDGSDQTIYIGVKEIKRKSNHYNAESEANGEYKDMGIMDVLDGGTYVTEESYLKFLISEGAVKKGERKLVLGYWNGTKTEADLDKVRKGLSKAAAATTHKPRFVGNRVRTLPNGVKESIPVYLKVAETVLTKKLAGAKGSRLYAIRRMMENMEKSNKGKQVRLTPKSGVKNGFTGTPLDISNSPINQETGEFEIAPEAIQSSTMEISMEGYARQLRTDYKSDKQVKNSGQMENLIWNSIKEGFATIISGEESNGKVNIREAYENVIQALYDLGFDNVSKRFDGLTDEEIEELSDEEMLSVVSKQTKDAKLRKLILSSLRAHSDIDPTIENPLLEEELELDSKGDFVHDIANSRYLINYMDAIRKTVEKNTVNKKRQGSQLPLTPDEGYDLRTYGTDREGIILFDNAEIEKDGTLRPQIKGEKGKPGKPAQILVPFEMKLADGTILNMQDFVVDKNKGEGKPHWVIDSRALPKELFNQIGFRTPTQDYNMMASIEVVGFLPRANKMSVVAPKEFIATMGSDFDIDKLFAYKYYLRKVKVASKSTGKTRYTYRLVDEEFAGRSAQSGGSEKAMFMALQNRRQRILQTLLNDNTIIENDIVAKLNGEDAFADFAEDNYKTLMSSSTNPDIGKLSYLSAAYNEIKRNNAITAASALAVFAKLARVSSQLRFTNMPIFKKVKGKLVATTLSLGSGDQSLSIKRLGGDSSLFNDTSGDLGDDKYREATYDKAKNNISALISIAVDNENLQMIHKLGIGDNSYHTISAFILGGFRAKTALAVTNMAFQDSAVKASRIKARLIKEHNAHPDKIETIAASSAKGTTKVVSSSDFSGVANGMQEMDLVEKIISLNKKQRSGVEMSPQEIQDYLALMDFSNALVKSYKMSVSKVGWAFNMDSKGFSREVEDTFARMDSLNDESMTPVWDAMMGIKEVSLQIQAFEKFTNKVEDIFSKSPFARQVMGIISDIGIKENMYAVSKAVLSYKYRNSRPNTASLIGRLETILHSKDSEVQELKDSNLFLSRLSINFGKIDFKPNAAIAPVDIINDLEYVQEMGEVAGIDMKLLHKDLVAYAVTNRAKSYALDFSKFVRPKYFTELEESNMDNLDPNYIAAYIAFDNMNNVVESTVTKAAESGITLFKTLAEDGSYRLVYTNREGKPVEFTQDMAEAFTRESSAGSSEKLLEPLVPNTPITDRVKLAADKVIERVMSFKSDLGVKLLMKMLYPNSVVMEASDNTSNVNTSVTRMKLRTIDENGNPVSTRRLKGSLTHEAMHVFTIEVVEAYRSGTLEDMFLGENVDGKAMAAEITRVLDSLDTARHDLVEGMLKAMKTGKGTLEGTSGPTLDGNTTIMGVLRIASNKLPSGADKLIPKSIADKLLESKSDVAGSIADMIAIADIIAKGKYMFKDGLLYVQKEYINGNNVSNTTDVNDYHQMYYMDSAMEPMFDVIKNIAGTPEGLEALADMMLNKLVESDKASENADELFAVSGLIYAASDLDEFLAESYSLGTKTRTDSGKMLPGMNELSNYKAAMGGVMPAGIAKIMHKAFELLRKLVEAAIGKKNSNEIFKDAMYVASLTKMSKFVKPGEGNDSEYVYSDDADNLTKTCK